MPDMTSRLCEEKTRCRSIKGEAIMWIHVIVQIKFHEGRWLSVISPRKKSALEASVDAHHKYKSNVNIAKRQRIIAKRQRNKSVHIDDVLRQFMTAIPETRRECRFIRKLSTESS